MDLAGNQVVVYEDGELRLDVNLAPDMDTVWLDRNQLSMLFETDRTVIGRHIRSIYDHGELDRESTCAKNAHVPGTRNRTYDTEFFNLDVILAIGYRVNARKGVAFRKWASGVLKKYILEGYAVNARKVEQLGVILQIMERIPDQLDTKQVLDVVKAYSSALELLDDYDHERIPKPSGTQAIHRLTYQECRALIDSMDFSRTPGYFGIEHDDSFQSSISTIFQTFDGSEVYPTLQEKAAALLYLIVKNHSFVDGNKRIAAAIFLHFLNVNVALWREGHKIIEDHTLVALVIMIAESNPNEMETMIRLVMTFLARPT